MLYHLLVPLAKFIGPLNVFRYVTFRTAGAFLTALLITLLLGPKIIDKLSAMRARQVVREDGPQSHLKKAGTPTMGGVLILLAVTSARSSVAESLRVQSISAQGWDGGALGRRWSGDGNPT